MSILTLKESAETHQPLLLCEFQLTDGSYYRVATHPLHSTYAGTPSSGTYEFGGFQWEPRIVNQDIGATQAMSDLGLEVVPDVTISMADPDKAVFNIEYSVGFKGAILRMYAVMWDPTDTGCGTFSDPYTSALIKFIGTCHSPRFDDRSITISATSLLNMFSMQLPPIRIQQRCAWPFPVTDDDRYSGAVDMSSSFWECGYSYGTGASGAVGNPNGSSAFDICPKDFDSCIARLGDTSATVPINQDIGGNPTGRFGGFRFIPSQESGKQRSYLTGKWEELINVTNEARYGDFVPMCYGPTWVEPLVMGAYIDGNYHNFEVLVSYGQIENVKKIVVNGQEVPRLADDEFPSEDGSYRPLADAITSDAHVDDFKNGYWKTINNGSRNGRANPEPGWGKQGDPYGSTTAIYISVLQQVAQAGSIPKIQVLLEGQKIRTYSDVDTYAVGYTSNPVWILLDILIWSTWRYADIDIASFITAASKCDTQINFMTMSGLYTNVYLESGSPVYRRYSVGLTLRQRRTTSDIIRGLRNAMKALLFFDYNTGKLKIQIKETLAEQQDNPVTGSNFNDPVPSLTAGGGDTTGYVAYKFDHTNILKDEASGKSSLSVYQRINQDCPNKVTIQLQNRENSYSQDTITILDDEDVSRMGHEVAGGFPLDGCLTFDHAKRVVGTWFAENYRGNDRLDRRGSAQGDTGGTMMFELETSVKGIHLMVGQICLLSDVQLGLEDQLVRVMKIQPATNFETVKVTLMWHNDVWYLDTYGQTNQPIYARNRHLVDRLPFAWGPDHEAPITGDALYDPTDKSFGLMEYYETKADGTSVGRLRISGKVPVNVFQSFPGAPKLELTGIGISGGGYPTNKTYFVYVAATSGESQEFISQVSRRAVVRLQSPDDGLRVVAQHWDKGSSGFVAFVGDDAGAPSYQGQNLSSTPSLIDLANNYNHASWSPPDEALQRFRWQMRRERHPGIFTAEVFDCGTGFINLSVYDNYSFTSGALSGRELSVHGIANVSSGFSVPLASFIIDDNVSGALSVSSGDPTTCVNGNPLVQGDVVVVRMALTYGSDANGRYFEDSLLINSLNPVGDWYTVLDATNASPIVVRLAEIGADFPFVDGDRVVVRGVDGNTAANGGFDVANSNAGAGTFELDGSSGNAAYVSGGTVAKQTLGLETDAEVGRLAFIIRGTGRGTYAVIKSNTQTRVYINGDWPVAPDSTSRIVIIDATVSLSVASDKIKNSVREFESTWDVDVDNYLGKSWFVQAFTESFLSDDKSPEPLTPFREIYLFGNPGGVVLQKFDVEIKMLDNPMLAGEDVLDDLPVLVIDPNTKVVLDGTATITAKFPPSGSSHISDVFVSSDQGATWRSMFPTGSSNKAVLPSGYDQNTEIELEVTELFNNDRFKVDVVQSGNAGGITIKFKGKRVIIT